MPYSKHPEATPAFVTNDTGPIHRLQPQKPQPTTVRNDAPVPTEYEGFTAVQFIIAMAIVGILAISLIELAAYLT